MGRLKNKIAVITGGARGLGEKIAETFYPLIENKMINSFKKRAGDN